MSLSFTALTGLPLRDGRRAGIDDSPLLLLPVLAPSVFENFIAPLEPTARPPLESTFLRIHSSPASPSTWPASPWTP